MNYKYLLKNAVFILATSFIISFSNFIFSPIYINKLGNDNFGILSLVISIGFLFYTVFSINNVALIVRYSNIHNKKKKIDFIGTAFVSQLIFIAFFLVIIFISKGSVIDYFFDKIKFNDYLKYALLIGVLNSLQSIPLGYYWGKKDFIKYRLIPISSFFLNLIFLLYFVVYKEGGIYDAIFSIILSSFIIGVFSLYKFFNVSKLIFNKIYFKIIYKFSLPILCYSFLGLSIDIIIRQKIENYLSLDIIGLYSIIYLISTIPIIILTSINNVWLPVIYSSSTKVDIYKLFKEYIYLSSRLVLFISITIGFFAKEFLLFFFENDFIRELNADKILIMMVICNTLFNFLWIHLSNEMNYVKKTNTYFITTLISFLITVLISTYIIKNLAFFGVSLMSIISNFIICFVAFLILRISLKTKINYKPGIIYYIVASFIFLLLLVINETYIKFYLFKYLIILLLFIFTLNSYLSYFKKNKLIFS